MGYVKTDAQRKADAIRRRRAMAAEDTDALRVKVKTWSAVMPAYAFTRLCPNPDFRS